MTPSERNREMAARLLGEWLTGEGPDRRGGKVVLAGAYLRAQSALAAALAAAELRGARAMQEAAAQKAEHGRFLLQDAPDAIFGKACAAAIRALSPAQVVCGKGGE